MKNRSYANRGMQLETFMKYSNVRYAASGAAFIQKQCTEFIPIRNGRGQVCSVKVEHKATVDFLGRYKQYPIAIEAKNTNEDSIAFDRVEPNQVEDMNAFTAHPGTIGIVLVSFNLRTFYAIPWAFWGYAYDLRVRRNDRKADVNLHAFGQDWYIPKKKSVREEELNPEWRVPSDDRQYGLHYLIKAEQYVTQRET